MALTKFKRGQIWWQKDMGRELREGVISDNRPVVIVSDDVNNIYSGTVIVVPITSKDKKDIPLHLMFNNYNGTSSTMLFEQIRAVPKVELGNYYGTLEGELLDAIDEKLKIALGLVEYPKTEIENTMIEHINEQTKIEKEPSIVNTEEKREIEIPKKKYRRFTRADKENLIYYYEKFGAKQTAEQFNLTSALACNYYKRFCIACGKEPMKRK